MVCGGMLNCNNHTCEKECHAGNCPPCQKDPSRVFFCPSGHNSIEKLIGRQRKNCTEPIPTCDALCERFLPCGKHQCIKQCHNDECMRCDQLVEHKCKCSRTSMKVQCHKVNYPMSKRKHLMTAEEIEEVDEYKCKRVCKQLKSCNQHACKEVCCPVKKELGRAGDP